MRIFTAFLLLGIGAFMTGCGSHDAKQAHDGDRNIQNRVDADRAHGVVAAPQVIYDRGANQTIDRAQNTIDAATVRTEQVTADVNHTARQVEVEAQHVTNDAAQLSNDANHAVNSAERDIDRLKNAFR